MKRNKKIESYINYTLKVVAKLIILPELTEFGSFKVQMNPRGSNQSPYKYN